jgi:hypothetical protein
MNALATNLLNIRRGYRRGDAALRVDYTALRIVFLWEFSPATPTIR